jgi:hypothetical protein
VISATVGNCFIHRDIGNCLAIYCATLGLWQVTPMVRAGYGKSGRYTPWMKTTFARLCSQESFRPEHLLVQQRIEASIESAKPAAHWCEGLALARPSPFYPLICDRQPRNSNRSFFRRPLAPGLIPFGSPESKSLLKEVLQQLGTSASFYDIMHAFDVQSDPASCGLASLAIALNAIGVSIPDTRPDRHHPSLVTEEAILDAYVSEADRPRVRAGVDLDELTALAGKAPGARVRAVRGGGGDGALEAPLRAALAATAQWPSSPSPRGATGAAQTLAASSVGGTGPAAARSVVVLNFSRFLSLCDKAPLQSCAQQRARANERTHAKMRARTSTRVCAHAQT